MKIDSMFALRTLAVFVFAMVMTLRTAQAKEPRVSSWTVQSSLELETGPAQVMSD